MAGPYERCGATAKKANGNLWKCYKKKGHADTGSSDNRTHVDTKSVPNYRWKEEPNESR